MQVDNPANSRAPSSADPSANRRANPRFPVDEDSTLLFIGRSLPLASRILDLSLEGCCMRAEGRFPSHLRCQVEVTFKVNGLPFRLGGLIQRCSNSNEVGIRFVGVSARRMAEWGELVAEVEEDLAAKRARIGVAAARPQA